MQDRIKKILDYAIWAPSGDNSQPWEFSINGNKLDIFLLPEKDNVYLNFKLGGSYISHGCLVENIKIASTFFGLDANINLLPDSQTKLLTATIEFTEKVSDVPPLFDFIKQRVTNRHFYKKTEFSEVEKKYLMSGLECYENCSLKLVSDEAKKKLAGSAGADAEIVILENEQLHKSLFEGIVWNKGEELEKKHGLLVTTMEFNPVQKLLFKLASNWQLMKVVIKLGFPRFIAKEDSFKYSSGAGVFLITCKSENEFDFIKAGQMFQQVWLRATNSELAFQPVIASIFLNKSLNSEVLKNILSEEHRGIILESDRKIRQAFALANDEFPMIMFRIGIGSKVSAKSIRISVEEKMR